MTNKEKDNIIKEQAEKIAAQETEIAKLRQEVYDGQVEELRLRRQYMPVLEKLVSKQGALLQERG